MCLATYARTSVVSGPSNKIYQMLVGLHTAGKDTSACGRIQQAGLE